MAMVKDKNFSLERVDFKEEIRFYKSVSSTNDVLAIWAREGAPDGSAVVADFQESGRGKQGRVWVSSQDQGGLHYSFLVRDLRPDQSLSQLSFVVAVSVGRAIRSFLEKWEQGIPEEKRQKVKYKWPNDILIDGRKGGGILIETSGVMEKGESPSWNVIGIGINIGSGPLLEGGERTGFLNPGERVSSLETRFLWRKEILSFLREAWKNLRQEWSQEGFEKIRQEWLFQAKGLYEPIRVSFPQGEKKGIFLGIDNQGKLWIQTSPGKQESIASGDVFLESNT